MHYIIYASTLRPVPVSPLDVVSLWFTSSGHLCGRQRREYFECLLQNFNFGGFFDFDMFVMKSCVFVLDGQEAPSGLQSGGPAKFEPGVHTYAGPVYEGLPLVELLVEGFREGNIVVMVGIRRSVGVSGQVTGVSLLLLIRRPCFGSSPRQVRQIVSPSPSASWLLSAVGRRLDLFTRSALRPHLSFLLAAGLAAGRGFH